MIALKIISIALGLAFLLFGYFIYFRKKYNLINAFEKDYIAGRKTLRFAKHVGIIELILGAVLLAIGFLLIIFA